MYLVIITDHTLNDHFMLGPQWQECAYPHRTLNFFHEILFQSGETESIWETQLWPNHTDVFIMFRHEALTAFWKRPQICKRASGERMFSNQSFLLWKQYNILEILKKIPLPCTLIQLFPSLCTLVQTSFRCKHVHTQLTLRVYPKRAIFKCAQRSFIHSSIIYQTASGSHTQLHIDLTLKGFSKILTFWAPLPHIVS